MPVEELEGCLLACISALLFVFSARVDESTDWQSDDTLDDSAKPWLGLAVQLFTERERKKEVGECMFLCVCVCARQRSLKGHTKKRKRSIQKLKID